MPQPDDLAGLTAERQAQDPNSMLALYREAIALRKDFSGYSGPDLTWHDAPAGCLSLSLDGGVHLLLNCTSRPVPFTDIAPTGRTPEEIILSSTPQENESLSANTAVWLPRQG